MPPRAGARAARPPARPAASQPARPPARPPACLPACLPGCLPTYPCTHPSLHLCPHIEASPAKRSRSLSVDTVHSIRLVQLLGDGWTVEVNNAWAAAWNVIENHMVAIAQSARKRLVD